MAIVHAAEARQHGPLGRALHFDPLHVGITPSDLAKHHVETEKLCIGLGHEPGLTRLIRSPDLADLNLLEVHPFTFASLLPDASLRMAPRPSQHGPFCPWSLMSALQRKRVNSFVGA